MMQYMAFSECSRNALLVISVEKVVDENTGSAKSWTSSPGEIVECAKVLG